MALSEKGESMFRNRMVCLILAVFICSALVVSCSKKSEDGGEEAAADETVIEDGATGAGSQPAATGAGAAASGIQPSEAPKIEGTPGAVQMIEDARKRDAEYQGEVVLKINEGGIQYNAIKSKSKCTIAKDCANTKYINAPKSEGDCACAAACTPFVVNKTEKKLREAANEKLCDQNDWYGATCPAPPCNFMGFDMYKCIDEICFGLAAGRN